MIVLLLLVNYLNSARQGSVLSLNPILLFIKRYSTYYSSFIHSYLTGPTFLYCFRFEKRLNQQQLAHSRRSMTLKQLIFDFSHISKWGRENMAFNDLRTHFLHFQFDIIFHTYEIIENTSQTFICP